MKSCTVCQQKKRLSEFQSNRNNKDGKQCACRACHNARNSLSYRRHRSKRIKQMVDRTRARKAYLHSLKHMKPCADCRVKHPHYVMDYDHVRGKKKFELARACGRSNKAVLEELAKCDLVCSNCHRKRTYKRGGWRKDPLPVPPLMAGRRPKLKPKHSERSRRKRHTKLVLHE